MLGTVVETSLVLLSYYCRGCEQALVGGEEATLLASSGAGTVGRRRS